MSLRRESSRCCAPRSPRLACIQQMPWLTGNNELAERLESERQTVRIVMSTIDAVVNRLLQDELIAASIRQAEGRHAAPAA